jgi:hypothetical protein
MTMERPPDYDSVSPEKFYSSVNEGSSNPTPRDSSGANTPNEDAFIPFGPSLLTPVPQETVDVQTYYWTIPSFSKLSAREVSPIFECGKAHW